MLDWKDAALARPGSILFPFFFLQVMEMNLYKEKLLDLSKVPFLLSFFIYTSSSRMVRNKNAMQWAPYGWVRRVGRS